MARILALPLLMTVALAAHGCTGKNPYAPGESLGSFAVTGKLVSTSCGATPDPWSFEVKLRHEDATLYWVHGGIPISGKVDKTAARVVLKASETQTVRPADAKKKLAACTMSREDTVDLVLSPVTLPLTDLKTATEFKGALSYRFAAGEAADCSDQLLETGGDYAAIPCEVRYELSAKRVGE
ncbi:MAG: hypothetical protein KF819_40435 [Labilithrix sp.]|nr:hypothetical protein [Labilithrix sp.]